MKVSLHWCFVGLISLAGLVGIFVIPPFSSNDAPMHYLRAYQISRGEVATQRFGPNALGTQVPQHELDFIYGIWPFHWKGFERSREYLKNLHRFTAHPESPLVNAEFTNAAVYSPLNYLGQSLGLALGRLLTTDLVWRYHLLSFFNLLSYLLLGFFTLRLRTGLERLYFVFLTLPFIALQSVAVGPDAFNYAYALFYSANLIAVARVSTSLSDQQKLNLGLLSVGLVLLKPNHSVLLLFLLLLPKRHWRYGLAIFILSVGSFLAWNLQFRGINITHWLGGQADPQGQIALIKSSPWEVIKILLRNYQTRSLDHWIEGYGGEFFTIQPQIFKTARSIAVIALAGACLISLASWHTSPKSAAPLGRLGWLSLVVGIGGALGTYLIMWITCNIGFDTDISLQHRYFFIFIFFVVLGLGWLFHRLKFSFAVLSQWGFGLAVISHFVLIINALFLYAQEWRR